MKDPNITVNFTWDRDPRESLPDVKDEDNPLVWCERCKREHKKYTFTRADWDRIIEQAAQDLADAITDAAIEEFFNDNNRV